MDSCSRRVVGAPRRTATAALAVTLSLPCALAFLQRALGALRLGCVALRLIAARRIENLELTLSKVYF